LRDEVEIFAAARFAVCDVNESFFAKQFSQLLLIGLVSGNIGAVAIIYSWSGIN
jgi:hypothetical protein